MDPIFNHVREEYLPKGCASRYHTVDVWYITDDLPKGRTPDRQNGNWVIYLHGEAWRDPGNNALDFVPKLLRSFRPLQ